MPKQFYLLLTVLLLAFAFVLAMYFTKPEQKEMKQSLNGATQWFNSEPLSLPDIKNKVVLINFWTYTCINWRRTLPYINEWATKYKDDGLVVIGVHTPEFLFEHQNENIQRSIQEMNIQYPVAVDNNYEIWNSFQNSYWPAVYLIDAKGNVRYKKFGEEGYRESELMIRELLKEISPEIKSSEIAKLSPGGYEAAADWNNLRSPENFLGYDRTQGFMSPEKVVLNKEVVYSIPEQLQLNQWAIAGVWKIGGENILLQKENGRISYKFHARDLHLIAGAYHPNAAIRFRLMIDGKSPGISHGLDVDSNGYGQITFPRMYQLIRQQGPIMEHEFQIEFLDSGVEVYDFTFG